MVGVEQQEEAVVGNPVAARVRVGQRVPVEEDAQGLPASCRVLTRYLNSAGACSTPHAEYSSCGAKKPIELYPQ